ncbi:hypothetical protein NAL32_18855 [Chryseobacterium sp. Ch-15]|uniref:Uncharacterized protein n=1 Tax=Chryseobacterium muglaense TaxID=2893752 RepID=A0A9Q3UXU3_9FLAO|nr:hypothetical protein [Chryseobacterium muglaense]MBD3907190.1 hypothetical protein [Chryseobacterium muglaense]MCC9036357.1 hypothetical protein [Chryseobacterium muglaense]MCM2556452.1 hypothetical protein [Chryseobacterium muglaense]
MINHINFISLFSSYIIDSFKNDDDFLVVLLIMGAIFFAIVVIIGVVLCLLFILLLIGLITAGILSTSVLIGIQQKSVSKGFKTFFLGVSMVGCTIVSIIFFWFVNSVKEWWDTNISIVIGVFCGVLVGYILGLLMFVALKKIISLLQKKYQTIRNISKS